MWREVSFWEGRLVSLPALGWLCPKPEPSEAVQSHRILVAKEAPEESSRWEPFVSIRGRCEAGGIPRVKRWLTGGGCKVPFSLRHLLSTCGRSDVVPPSPPGAL